MIHIDSAKNPNIQADLGKLQIELPDDYSQLKNMGLARKWSIIIYPSASAFPFANRDDFMDCLQNYCSQHNLRACMSPLHDSDYLADGVPEEPHYHFFTVSHAPMYSQMIGSLCYYLNGNLPMIRKVENEVGYFRYYTHQDDDDKAEYSSDDIVCFNSYSPPPDWQRFDTVSHSGID